MTQPTLSPRTLGMYYGCAVKDTFNRVTVTNPASVFKYIEGGALDQIKLILKRQPFHSNHARNLSLFDDMRKDGYDMGGFIIQNGTETWVASLIDAGVAVEMEATKEAPKVEPPYLKETVTKVVRKYNPNYGDDRECKCGHPYYRHFDSYENNLPCGCKYCECDTLFYVTRSERKPEQVKECDAISVQPMHLGERYRMCSDQPAQIDCRVTTCLFYKGGGNCSNISPAITLNENGKFVCWSCKTEKPTP